MGMNREQAINYLISSGFSEEQINEIAKAFEPTTKNDLGVVSGLEKNSKKLEKDFGELDCISRADALSDKGLGEFHFYEDYAKMRNYLKSLPSVTLQEPKTGHWIPTYGNVECSVCGSVKDSRNVGKATHYCDFCGAKMESEDKE